MSVKSPRIALLLSGLPRLWRPCLSSQLDLLQNYPYDVFFHFWDTIDAREKNEIIDLLKPKAYSFEAPKDFSHLDTDTSLTPDQINIPSRIFSQYYSWRSVGRLVEPFKADYDLAMRSRADLQFVYSLDHMLPKLKPNDIVIPWWNEKIVLSDLFSVGGVEPILYYHTLYDHVRGYAATRELNAELMLTVHFEQRPDIHIYTDQSQYFFVRRPHMDNYTVEQAMLENPGRNKWLDPEVAQAHANYHQQKKGEEGASYFRGFQQSQLHKLVNEIDEKKYPNKS